MTDSYPFIYSPGELLWIDLFNWVNFGFCVLALLESFWVSHLYHGEHGVEEELIIKKEASEMAELSVAELSAALIEKRHITTQWVDNVSKHLFPAACERGRHSNLGPTDLHILRSRVRLLCSVRCLFTRLGRCHDPHG